MKKGIAMLLICLLIAEVTKITGMTTDIIEETAVLETEGVDTTQMMLESTEGVSVVNAYTKVDEEEVLLKEVQSTTTMGGNETDIQTISGTLRYMPSDIGASSAEWEILMYINVERAKIGVKPLFMREDLQTASNTRAIELHTYFNHTRPDGRDCFSVLTDNNISYTFAGENIAKGQASPYEVVMAWMNSPGHRENILNPDYSYVGIGEYSRGWVQLFTDDNLMHTNYGMSYDSPTLITNNPDDLYSQFFVGVLYNGEYTYTPILRDVFPLEATEDGSRIKVISKKNEVFVLMTKYDPNLAQMYNLKASGEGDGKVRLTWSQNESVTGYLVYAQKNGRYAYAGMTTKGTQFLDTKALVEDYNFYWVFPYVEGLDGKMFIGNPAKYVFAKGNCAAVTNLKASSVKGGVKLSWNTSVGAEGYLVYGISSNGKYSYVGMTTKGTTYTDTKASKEEYNYYWVYPYHTDNSGKMIVGGTAKYTYGRAL